MQPATTDHTFSASASSAIPSNHNPYSLYQQHDHQHYHQQQEQHPSYQPEYYPEEQYHQHLQQYPVPYPQQYHLPPLPSYPFNKENNSTNSNTNGENSCLSSSSFPYSTSTTTTHHLQYQHYSDPQNHFYDSSSNNKSHSNKTMSNSTNENPNGTNTTPGRASKGDVVFTSKQQHQHLQMQSMGKQYPSGTKTNAENKKGPSPFNTLSDCASGGAAIPVVPVAGGPLLHLPHHVVNDLYQCLRSQVEFYFSDANLSRDGFLQSLLNSCDHPGRVPVATIASFPKVREIYASAVSGYFVSSVVAGPADPLVLGQALVGSPYVQLSEDGHWFTPVRAHSYTYPSHQDHYHHPQVQEQHKHRTPPGYAGTSLSSQRNNHGNNKTTGPSDATIEKSESTSPTVSPTSFDTGETETHASGSTTNYAVLILHDVDKSVKENEILKVLQLSPNDTNDAHVGIRQDTTSEGVWTLVFDSVERAQKAMHYCQANKVELNGNPIRATLSFSSHHQHPPEDHTKQREAPSPSLPMMGIPTQQVTTPSPMSSPRHGFASAPHYATGTRSASTLHHPVPLMSHYLHNTASSHFGTNGTSPGTAQVSSSASTPMIMQHGSVVGYHHHHHMHTDRQTPIQVPPITTQSVASANGKYSSTYGGVHNSFYPHVMTMEYGYPATGTSATTTTAVFGAHYHYHHAAPRSQSNNGSVGDNARFGSNSFQHQIPLAQIYVNPNYQADDGSHFASGASLGSFRGGQRAAAGVVAMEGYYDKTQGESQNRNRKQLLQQQQQQLNRQRNMSTSKQRRSNKNKPNNMGKQVEQGSSVASSNPSSSSGMQNTKKANSKTPPRSDRNRRQFADQRSPHQGESNGVGGSRNYGGNRKKNGQRGGWQNKKKNKQKGVATDEAKDGVAGTRNTANPSEFMTDEHFPALCDATSSKVGDIAQSSAVVAGKDTAKKQDQKPLVPYVAALLQKSGTSVVGSGGRKDTNKESEKECVVPSSSTLGRQSPATTLGKEERTSLAAGNSPKSLPGLSPWNDRSIKLAADKKTSLGVANDELSANPSPKNGGKRNEGSLVAEVRKLDDAINSLHIDTIKGTK